LVLLGLPLVASTVSAETWVVLPDSSGDAPTIQAGIDSAVAGDTVMVMCGTYHEHDIQIKSGIYLTSATGLADCVTISADTLGRVFYCGGVDASTNIVGFTATNGLKRDESGGGMYCDGSDARFTNCTFHINHSDVSAGAAYLYMGSPVFTGCVFSSNTVMDTCDGGAIRAYRGAPVFTGCTFLDNHAPAGLGGAFHYTNTGSPVLTGCHFERNRATRGGGVYLRPGYSDAVISGCTFRDNSATEGTFGHGGGLACLLYGSDVEISGCTFEYNSAWGGGGMYTYDSSPTITDCTFRENTVTLAGAGISCTNGGNPTIIQSRFYDNTAALRGGGADVASHAVANFEYCAFAGNIVTGGLEGDGGAGMVVLSGGVANVTNCTFYANSTAGSGGGLLILPDSPATLDNCIIAFAGNGGAVSIYGGPEPVFTCTDIYGNVGGDWVGDIADQFGVSGNISVDPLFVDPTGYDLHLLLGSPCIDTGGCGLIGAYGPVDGYGIRSVEDVSRDQGGFIDLEWVRISFDSAGSDTVVEGYSIWRRVDPSPPLGSRAETATGPGRPGHAPPGTWELIDSVAATGQPIYETTCPTDCDSTGAGICWSAYYIKAHCSAPILEFDTPPDSGYSADNTANEGWTEVATYEMCDYDGYGSGLAWVDYDNDGDLDVYFTNRVTDENRLFRNDDLTPEGFVEATPPILAGSSNSRGCPWGDYDNDGDLDLYISNKGSNRLIRNDGGGNFTDVTASPLDDPSTGQTSAWLDFDNDGDLDLYQVNNGANKLFRNDSAGIFTDVTSGPLGDANWAMGLGVADYDNDGDVDIYVANYDGANVLLENEGGGVFTDVTTAVIESARPSYGATWGDYDNDGDLDLYVTNEGANNLFRNNGSSFEDVSVYPIYDGSRGRGAAWGDYNLDGHLDLYLVNYGTLNKLFRNKGDASFEEAPCTACPFMDGQEGFSAAWADFDKDGDLDFYVVNDDGRWNRLLRNELVPGHHWLEVDPTGVISNSDGIGARVRIVVGGEPQMREICSASGFASQGPLTAWFGLGPETVVDTIEVTWPASGIVQTLTGVTCDQTIVIYEVDLSGVGVGDVTRPSTFRLYPGRPNPFSTVTTIRFDLPVAALVDLAIYDVSGRMVRGLIDESLKQPGRHTAYWNGLNGKGERVASGVYFCRLRAGSYVEIGEVLLLK
jgi:hypothetical protein